MGVRILVVDDDEIAGGLSRDLLMESGYEADLLTSSLRALDQIKKNDYALVILDILMPGIDGLSLCHKIKNDPATRNMRVIMVSGKSFEADKKRARQYGASAFIEKPYNVESFVQQVQEVLGRGTASAVPAQAQMGEKLSASDGVMEIGIWGCRSGGPHPAEPSAYGRKSSSVTLDIGEHFMFFDAGLGIADAGAHLEAEGKRKDIWLFMSHFHQDHTEGLPAFSPAGKEQYKIHIAGAHEPEKSLQDLVAQAFRSGPPKIPAVNAAIELYDLLEDTYDILPGVRLTSFYANHPGNTLAFIIETKGRKFVYCPDSEIYGERATAMQDYDEKLGRLCKGADFMIHDARYTAEDYQSLKNNGHSSFVSAVDFAGRNDIKKLLLFHHDNNYTDEALDSIGVQSSAMAVEKGYAVQVAMARDGLKLSL